MTNNYYIDFFEMGQQVINFNFYQIGLPTHDAVYTLKKIMEDLDFSRLLARYSNKGRKGYNPIMMFAVILYANMRGIRAVDRIVELCERDIAFIWLTKGEKPKRDAFYDFKNDKLLPEIMEDLHYQFIRLLQREGHVSLKALYIDGTKVEANANRYTFIWRGSINYRLSNLLTTVEELFKKYNQLIRLNGYDVKYELSEEEMFVIEGMDKVRMTVEKNRQLKKNKKKKISNNTIIEIDNISPLKILKLQLIVARIAKQEQIVFATGKGQRKTELQKLWEALNDCGERLLKYKEYFFIMGKERNSFSKTDLEATFMRMKDDHMRNGQLKPAYNVQIAVENYFIIHTYVSADRTDYNTLIPVLEKHKKVFSNVLEEVTADSGYCSEKNLLYLDSENIESYIKLQEHEKKKTRAYKNDIGKHYNMTRVQTDLNDYYLCHDKRKLELVKIEISHAKGFEQQFHVYESKDCTGCKHKSSCLNKYDETKDQKKNKSMKVNIRWCHLKNKSDINIQSDKGILNRQIRSIQTEGHFGNLKENHEFRRFYYRSKEKVHKEFMLYAMGQNLMKYHRFEQGELKKYVGKVA